MNPLDHLSLPTFESITVGHAEDIRALSYALLESSDFADHWLYQRYSRYATAEPLPALPYFDTTGMILDNAFATSVVGPAATAVATDPVIGSPTTTAAASRKRRRSSATRKLNVPTIDELESMPDKERKKVEKALRKKERELNKNLVCFDCGDTTSSFWRKTADKKNDLCNACGKPSS
ncbi:UNVERIFIED_CONTAM: hypothetical protein HDU68_008204 [Siphonaria sp. JEL0065]|nr:hypothetical protein HDU68_008204 [Siphonaria sp. JEL0065]